MSVLEATSYMVYLEEHVYPLGNGQGLPQLAKVSHTLCRFVCECVIVNFVTDKSCSVV